MLQADKNLAYTQFQLKALEIREFELKYFVSLYSNIASAAAFIAGFAFSALNYQMPKDCPMILEILYLIATAATMGFEIVAIANGTFLRVLGPGKALRGQGMQSMDEAIDVCEQYAKPTLFYFKSGIYGMVITSIMLAWLSQPWYVSLLLITPPMIGLLWIMHIKGEQIFQNMFVSRETGITTSKFRPEDVADPSRDIIKPN